MNLRLAPNKTRIWTPELRRAVIRVCPDYFSWDRDTQEKYRMDTKAEHVEQVAGALHEELFPRGRNKELSSKDVELFNAAILPFCGIGEDAFYLNEILSKPLTDFQTLRDFDEDDFRFQEQERKKDIPDYEGRTYYGSLYLAWARLFVGDTFTYATLSMLHSYVYAILTETAETLLETLIPHTLVPGKNHGAPTACGVQWDMRVQAGGKEDLLEQLRRSSVKYIQARADAIALAQDTQDPQVFILEESTADEASVHILFNNKECLSQVNLRTFYRNCKALQGSQDILDVLMKKEKADLSMFLESQYQEMLAQFDPGIRKLPVKSLSVVMLPEVFDSLK